MTRGRYAAFAAIAVVLSTFVTLAAVLAVDLHLHARYATGGGYNIWGYRGPVAAAKRPGEFRLAVLGGSTALGYGVAFKAAFPSALEALVNEERRRAGRGSASIVNLAWNSEGARSFVHTLRDYEYLGYDAALLYTGYNDLGGPGSNPQVFRHESVVFRLTGYLPIFPMILTEKAMALRYGGDVEAAYRAAMGEGRTVFTPNLAHRAAATALEAGARVTRELERQLEKLGVEAPAAATPEPGCGVQWGEYCRSVEAAVTYALAHGKQMIVVTQPYISDAHVRQQAALAAMLRERFGGDPRVQHVNLGRVVDLKDRSLAFDGMHLTARGNERIAQSLVIAVAGVLR